MVRFGSRIFLRVNQETFKRAGSPDGMFTAGPISESDFFTWEALICGPKDTPFVSWKCHHLL